MKTKQLLLIVVLLVALIAAWLSALGAASNKEAIQAQNNAVAAADVYAEKELWVRAIPKYEEALTYKTDAERARAIEVRLLAAYYAYGDTESYLSLVQARIAANVAAEEEYLNAAKICFASNDPEEAFRIVKLGRSRLNSEACDALYEENRYGYTLKTSKMQTILPTKNARYMPAFNGIGWTFTDAKGRPLFGEMVFEYVSNFNEYGYAVVKSDGVYYVITQSGDRYSIDETGLSAVCALSNKAVYGEKDGTWGFYNADFKRMGEASFEEMTLADGGVLAAKKDGKWGVTDEFGAVLCGFQFEDAAVNSWGSVFADGAGAFCYDGKWYLLKPDGSKVFDATFAGMKAPESADGYIAVANEDGKWGFADRAGNLVIDYQYDDAKSFSNHLAPVLVGDEWVYISERGAVVIDNVFKEAYPFHNGTAVVILPDTCALLTLSAPNA
ncbi:MAG: WG repeat-containing protein [Oscillospiraceae bacterium]|nr:WG repeat-containing protein [Oscillospiraceae bacterium]